MQSEPREGALYDPSPWQHDEAFEVVAAFDDREAQRMARPQPAHPVEPRAAVAALGPDEPQAHEAVQQTLQHQLRPVAVLNARRVDETTSSRPMVSTRMCRLRPLTFLPVS